MRIQNSCTEAAIAKAVEKHFPGSHPRFNQGDTAQNDLQVVTAEAFEYFPGNSVDCFALHRTPADRAAFKATLAQLNNASVYMVRAGQNGGAGHFSFIYHDDRRGWILADANSEQVLIDTENNLIDHSYASFSVSGEGLCGLGQNQYSMRLDELTRERTLAGMNYVAAFRLQQTPETYQSEEGLAEGGSPEVFADLTSRRQGEILAVGPQRALYQELKTNCEGFYKPSEAAKTYWEGTDFDAINNYYTQNPRALKDAQIQEYTHMLIKKNDASFLQKLLSTGFSINDACDAAGNTLLHMAIKHQSLHALQALLAAGANRNAMNAQGQTALVLLHAQLNTHDETNGRASMETVRARLEAAQQRGEMRLGQPITDEYIQTQLNFEKGAYIYREYLALLDAPESPTDITAVQPNANALTEDQYLRLLADLTSNPTLTADERWVYACRDLDRKVAYQTPTEEFGVVVTYTLTAPETNEEQGTTEVSAAVQIALDELLARKLQAEEDSRPRWFH